MRLRNNLFASMSTKMQRWSEVKGPVSKGRKPACVILSMTRGEQAMKSICFDPLPVVGGVFLTERGSVR